MDSYSVFLTLLAGYISFLFIIGYLFNRRQISLREFLLGGRRAGPLSIGFSAAASWLTAGALLAVIGFFMLLGMGSIWGFVAPNILALLALALIVPKIRSIPAMTQPELLEIRYGSFLRLPVAIIIIVVMILFTVADIKGFAMVLQVFYGIDTMQAAIIVGLSVAVYVTLGGLSAVIATDIIQYLCLAGFILVMAVLVMTGAGEVSEMNKQELFLSSGSSWWNPLSIGLPMILIFCIAILPGWISEQDPWQKIWAARDEKSAQKGMLIGAILVLVAFSGCAIIALGLNVLYPEIGAMGFPMGLAKGESALLGFIMDSGFSDFAVALCGVALATAAMSCADTFAASGASCIARDIYQRYLNPAASVKQMILINRLSVLIIIGCSVIGSFFIESIIDAIHIATFIASASYFFALMGGIYWKRGTGVGAGASLIIGFVLQSTLIIVDLIATQKGAPPYLESLHPLLMGHGVILAMAVSGTVYLSVSMLTRPSEGYRLAPFFRSEAKLLAAAGSDLSGTYGFPEDTYVSNTLSGNTIYFRVSIEFSPQFSWEKIVRSMSLRYPYWISWCGLEAVRRCTRADIISSVSLTPGETQTDCWLEIEGDVAFADQLRRELASAYGEVQRTIDIAPNESSEDGISSARSGLPSVHDAMSIALMADRAE